MKKQLPGFLCGCLTTVTALALGTTVLAASGQVTFNFANVALDGEAKITAGSTITAPNGQQVPGSILYTDAAGGKTNYLPIRAISELLSVEVGYDSATKTVLLGDQVLPAAQKHWEKAVDGSMVTYTAGESDIPYTEPPAWRPTWLPAGWKLWQSTLTGRAKVTQRFSGASGDVSFICAYPDKTSIGADLRFEETIQNCRQITIQGYPADLYVEEEGWTYLVWEGPDGILFFFSGRGISVEDLTKLAESVQPDAGQLPEYELSWMPEGYTKYERNVSGSAVQETWLGPDTSLTLLYASDPVELPDGTPEAVKVNGVDAQYWEAEEPYEPGGGTMTVNGEEVEGSQVEIGGVSISTGTIVGPGAAGVNTLAWTDPDTGIFFRIHGTVDQNTMLRIAEHVKRAA